MRIRWHSSCVGWVISIGLAFAGGTAAGQVDPALIGTWKLSSVPGLTIYWQLRDDGMYRYFGTSARPLEHWGSIDIAAGKWSTHWAGGKDGGTYTLKGDVWTSTGSAGTSTWQRQWKPGTAGSSSSCPLIDVAVVERLFGSVVEGRGDVMRCDLRASGVGFSDSVKILVVDGAAQRYANVRKNAGAARPVVDVPGLGTAAFIDADALTILKGNRYASITVSMYPAHPEAVSNPSLIELGRSVVARL